MFMSPLRPFLNYEARLKYGTLVAKSDGVEFTIKDGYFCPALSKAVKNHEEGEKVFLSVKPQYVTDDKKVIQKILKEGEGYERPNEGAIVKLKVIGKVQDGTLFLKKGHDDEGELFEFKTDEEQVTDGLDKAVLTMKKGEVALLTIAPEYGFLLTPLCITRLS
ncbi:peptidyl-prolyl cis-trans isomerase FKBP62-like [Phaseolus vulgaris]|uniref:peptidyl-prolyl cis-trans isomerase FKBP62-like n=1 Tax=Phaseolus vulgaris TaxID=3885 RepID=UPI0035C9866D